MYGFKFCNRQAFKQQQKNRKKIIHVVTKLSIQNMVNILFRQPVNVTPDRIPFQS